MPTIGSLFSGIGGIDWAFQEAGFDIVYQVEIDDYCTQVLQRHWPRVRRYRDIFNVVADTLPPTDVITAGFPCQPFSVAGNQRGESDERFLWPEILRLVRAQRPRVVFLENVPGLRTNDGGATFKRILRELAEIGYDAQWHHLRASDVGAPHKRKRVFIVAYTKYDSLERGTPTRIDSHSELAERETSKKIIAAVDDPGSGMGNTQCTNLERTGQSERPVYSAPVSHRKANSTRNAGRRTTQSRLGRGANGLSARLDSHRWPAPPGPQYDWEPARTTAQTENRTSRIKALGNAVVPQVVYPIALAIREWLE